MGIAAKGYTHWDGTLRGRAFRWFTIARWGVKQSGRSKWLRRLVIVAWLPLLWWTGMFFVFGWATDVGTLSQAENTIMFKFLKGAYGGELADAVPGVEAGVGDLAPGERDVEDVDRASDDEQHFAALAATLQDGLAGRVAAPGAVAFQAPSLGLVERLQQRDRRQGPTRFDPQACLPQNRT